MGNYTTVTPLVFIITFTMSVLILLLPRRYIIIPFCISGYLITEYQRIVITGFDFTMLRIIISVSILRFLIRQELYTSKFYKIDKIFLFYVLSYMTIFTLRNKTLDAFISSLGFAISSIGIYFFLRIQIRDIKDIQVGLRTLAIISCIMSVSMLIELKTGKNIFYIFGGVPEYTVIREGRLRCQGIFEHPLLAGAFGATTIPMFVTLFKAGGNDKYLGFAAIIGCIIITLTSSSSGPLLAMLAAFFSIRLFFLRYKMRTVRWCIVISLIILHICMKAPVWALVGRFSIVGGSTGYHRFILIDNAIRRFGEWWLLGSETKHWGHVLWDVTNTYIAIGVRGGFISLVLLITFITQGFKLIGIAIFNIDNYSDSQKILWLYGCSIFSHLVAFFGMNYFGSQIHISFYMLFAIIIIHSQKILNNKI